MLQLFSKKLVFKNIRLYKLIMNNQLLTEKYKPVTSNDIIGNKDNVNKIKNWLSNFKNKVKDTKKILLISGEPGIGKTSIAHIILKEFGYSIIELNASDIRGGKAINDLIKKSLSFTNVLDLINDGNKPIAIIMDEIDTLVNGGPDKGGMSAFIDIIKSDIDIKIRGEKKDKILIYNPIICIYNNFFNKKLVELKKYSEYIEFENPTKEDIEPFLNKILQIENINFDNAGKNELLKYCKSDIRNLLNILQYIKIGYQNTNEIIDYNEMIDIESLFVEKNKSFDLNNEIIDFFSKDMTIDDTLELSKKDQFKVPLYIYEHSIDFIKYKQCSSQNKIDMYYDILDSYVTNDILQTNIFINHAHELNKYSSIYGCSNINKIINKFPYEKTFINFKPDITFPNILTRISQKGSNKKLIINIINSLNHIKINFTFNSIKILCEFIYQHLYIKTTKKSLINLCKYMKNKNIKIEDLNIILKLHKFYTVTLPKTKNISKKRMDDLKEIYENTEIDQLFEKKL